MPDVSSSPTSERIQKQVYPTSLAISAGLMVGGIVYLIVVEFPPLLVLPSSILVYSS
jgi:hypothetical protein